MRCLTEFNFPNSCLPQVSVACKYIKIVHTQYFISFELDSQLFHNRLTYVTHQCPNGVNCRGQLDVEGQLCSSWSNDIIIAEVWKPNQQLLTLVNFTGVVHDDYFLSGSLYTSGCSQETCGA